MKINQINLRALQTYNQTQNVKKKEKTESTFTDKLEISTKAKEMQVSSTYDVERAEKINGIKQDVESGNYKVDARKVAQNMLNYYRR